MLKVVVLVLVVVLVSCNGIVNGLGSNSYNITRQNALQFELFQKVAAEAAEASALAIPAVLEIIDSSEFRQSISGIQLFANATSEFILATLNATVQYSYITHGLTPNNPTLDVTLAQLTQLNFLPNFWERWVLNLLEGTNITTDVMNLYFQNSAETKLLGFPQFPNINNLSSITLEQAQSRVQYAAVDLWRTMEGEEAYGAITLVLDKNYLNDMVVLSPVDTGIYTGCCLDGVNCSKPFPWTNWNCFGNVSLGTLNDFTHLYIPSEDFDFIKYSLGDLVNRLFAEPTLSITVLQESNYWEADIFGNVLFPEGVQFVMGDLAALFGQYQGMLLRNWCIEMGWPLVWSKDALQAQWILSKQPFNVSIFDPKTVEFLGNVTISNTTIADFDAIWTKTNTSLSENPLLPYDPFYWNQLWETLGQSMPSNIHMSAIKPGLCAAETSCLGVDADGNCFCTYPNDNSSST